MLLFPRDHIIRNPVQRVDLYGNMKTLHLTDDAIIKNGWE